MTTDRVNEAIYDRFIKPTDRRRTRRVGLEFEFPILNTGDEPVDFAVIHSVTDSFIIKFGFSSIKRDDDGYIYFAEDTVTGDSISFDCSYNTIEFSLGAGDNIGLLNERLKRYYSYVKTELNKYGHTVTGMGINPGYAVNRNVPVVSERYRMLFHHLCSYKTTEKRYFFMTTPISVCFPAPVRCSLTLRPTVLWRC